MNSTNMQNLLLEEEEQNEEDVGSVLASSIEKGMRTVLGLSRAARPSAGNEIALAVPVSPRFTTTSTPTTPNLSSGRGTPSNENFEQVFAFFHVSRFQLPTKTLSSLCSPPSLLSP